MVSEMPTNLQPTENHTLFYQTLCLDITIACCNLVRYCAYQAREAKYLPGFRQQAALYDSAHMEPLITPARCH